MKNTAPFVLSFETTHLRARLEERLANLGKSARGASREAGMGESTIRNIMEGKSKSPKISTILKLAEVLDVNLAWFMESAILPSDKAEQSRLRRSVSDVEKLMSDPLSNAIRFMYPESMADGTYVVEKKGVFTNRPTLTQGSFGTEILFRVRNEEMMPIFRVDDQLLIKLDSELTVGEDFLFIKNNNLEKHIFAILARLMDHCGDSFSATTFNPERTFALPKAEWVAGWVCARFPKI